MGHKKAGVPGRRYTKEFKIEAVRLGQSVGYSEASRRLGMPESSLFNWVKLDRAGKLGSSTAVSATPRSAKELEAEVDRLRRELAAAKVDNEILKNGLRAQSRPLWTETRSGRLSGRRIVAVSFLEA
jgi:transposase